MPSAAQSGTGKSPEEDGAAAKGTVLKEQKLPSSLSVPSVHTSVSTCCSVLPAFPYRNGVILRCSLYLIPLILLLQLIWVDVRGFVFTPDSGCLGTWPPILWLMIIGIASRLCSWCFSCSVLIFSINQMLVLLCIANAFILPTFIHLCSLLSLTCQTLHLRLFFIYFAWCKQLKNSFFSRFICLKFLKLMERQVLPVWELLSLEPLKPLFPVAWIPELVSRLSLSTAGCRSHLLKNLWLGAWG